MRDTREWRHARHRQSTHALYPRRTPHDDRHQLRVERRIAWQHDRERTHLGHVREHERFKRVREQYSAVGIESLHAIRARAIGQ